MSNNKINKTVLAAVISTLLLSPVLLSAQVLEEIIVTAQRREQTLQEVPISIESFSGAEIQQQGYRNLDDLANFSATVLVDDDDFLSTERSIRGFGSSGNALTVEQAVPIFVDGIHHGRPGQVKNAFMDVEAVEVLKGPQPVYFGMSATAGAFNIRSASPTPEWEGYIDTELGNIGKGAVEAAIGGPITDTWGVRLAGKFETRDGFMRDVVDGRDLGEYENMGGRITIQWTPTDDFQATLKMETSQIEKFPEARHICLTEGTLLYRRNDPTQPGYPTGPERAVFADPPKGAGWVQPTEIDSDCFGSNKGISSGGPWFAPPINIHEETSDAGAIDAREVLDGWNKQLWIDTNGRAGSPFGIVGIEKIDNDEGSLDLNYTLGNGIEINSLTGYSHFKRLNWRDNSDSPFLVNQQDRVEIFHQVSQELRVTSPTGGMIEWMGGLFWQKTGYDITANHSTPGVRRGLRYNDIIREDQEWMSVFGNITFNFLDDRASIDLGGRYVDLKKSGAIAGVAGQFIFDEMPCDADRDDRTTDWQGPNGQPDRFDPALCVPNPDGVQIAAADAAFLLPDVDTSNLWILDYGATRNTPPNWRSPLTAAAGLFIYPNRSVNTIGGPENGSGLRRAPFVEGRVEDGVECCDFSSTEFDPQVTLRYRVSDDHSVFARWAQAFKAAGFDTGVTTINATVEDFRFDPENAETFELGAKGNLFNNAARYDVTVFRTDFNDFQITVPTGNPNDPFLNSNAGKQRVTGIEFGYTHAVSDQLTAGLAGAWMDGVMKFFPAGGCTPIEARTAPESGCVLDDPNDPDSGGTIDRSGEESPKTPDYKFVLRLDYWIPVLEDYKATWNFQGYISDGYLTDVNGFSKDVKMNKHEDINLSIGVGNMDDTWNLSVWGRNLLEARKSYNEEFDVVPSGFLGSGMGPSNFLTYGVKFRYNLR